MGEFSKVEKEGHLTVITINRPENMNALHPPASMELETIFNDFESDPEQWVAIITGTGDRAFSAGNDLKYQASGGDMSMPASGFAGLTSRYNMVKPVIAAVNGMAMGGGFEIALACDIIIASDKAIFALPEPKVGLAALAGGMHRLPRQIGLKRAMGMMLTARRVAAPEALQLGFVNEVVPHGELMAKAKQWANEILECAPLSIRTTKQVAVQGLKYANIEDAMNANYDQMTLMFQSEDVFEGPMAFAQKRKPNWKGK
ncbi:MAG: enoyl-CoA hydratase/isomerase family protein [Proteobacteria bacterium]|nr:enoyl-CoA hydratase/isomerase family protein [Pseudomonadota bacterium]MBU4470028.1 enoyl-CoA hydratase/isomerase family protein [Pseudomonadota bacterium]MCG2753808.1 enoyl-CoA hydratase-related protein [Desulfobacteraceae bacterium]